MIKGIRSVAQRQAEKAKVAEIKANVAKANSIASLKAEVGRLLEMIETLLK